MVNLKLIANAIQFDVPSNVRCVQVLSKANIMCVCCFQCYRHLRAAPQWDTAQTSGAMSSFEESPLKSAINYPPFYFICVYPITFPFLPSRKQIVHESNL